VPFQLVPASDNRGQNGQGSPRGTPGISGNSWNGTRRRRWPGFVMTAFDGREAAGADTEPDQAAAVRGREPDEAGATVGSRGWVVRVDEPGEGDAVLLLGRGQGIGVAGNLQIRLGSK
jgi:hypothetical protein